MRPAILIWMFSALAALSFAPPLAAQQDESRKAFRICQDPGNMPFSNTKGEGYENKIGELLASKLGLPVTYYSFPQRLAFIRNTLRYKLPNEDYRCDIVMGVPAGYDQVSATQPYYRSTYALVYVKGNNKGLDAVKSGADFISLDRVKLNKLKIGIYDKSPASDWLVKHGLEEQAVPYQIMSPNPEQYPGEIIEKDLVAGKIDAAVVWGPIAGYYAKRIKTAELVVIPLKSEPRVKFDYEMAMGVRYGEREWKAQIEKLITENRQAITAILREFNVPLINEAGEVIQ